MHDMMHGVCKTSRSVWSYGSVTVFVGGPDFPPDERCSFYQASEECIRPSFFSKLFMYGYLTLKTIGE